MHRVLALALIATGCPVLGACGRLAFDPAAIDADANADADDAQPAPCDLAAPFGTPIAISELNTLTSEGSFRLLPDELAGYFHSNLDLFRAVRPDLTSPFTFSPVTELNTGAIEQEPTVTADDLMIVFRRRVASDDELFYATRSSPQVPFDPPVLIASLSNIAVDSQPFLSPADGQLYFQSMRDGPDQDIYRSAYTGTTFAAPVLIDELRSNNEGDPVLSSDGLEIYWRTTRAGGLGGYDTWTARRATLGDPFGAIEAVANVNSIVDDGPSWISPDRCRLYLASRSSGNFDLFVASRP